MQNNPRFFILLFFPTVLIKNLSLIYTNKNNLCNNLSAILLISSLIVPFEQGCELELELEELGNFGRIRT